jgi:hypothetical protein
MGHEDTFFHFQVRSAGFQIVSRVDATVEHHFDPGRISREFFCAQAERHGQSDAYVIHHWLHHSVKLPGLRLAMANVRLKLVHVADAVRRNPSRLVGEEELRIRRSLAFYRQYLIERRRRPNYDREGFVKQGGEIAPELKPCNSTEGGK